MVTRAAKGRMHVRLPDGLTVLVAVVLVAAVLWGGGTRQGFLGDVVVQLLAIPLLLLSLWRLMTSGVSPVLVMPIAIVGLVVLGAAIQVLPMPPSLVTTLGWTKPDVTNVAGSSGWVTLSQTPQATWAALVSLLPPVAVFLATTQLGSRSRRWFATLVVALGVVSLVLGFVQVGQGPNSPLRFFEVTNDKHAVGFFANRNHFAALLYVTLVLAAPWIISATVALFDKSRFTPLHFVLFVGAGGLMLAVTAGLVTAGSRAGLLLGMAAILLIAFLTIQGMSQAARPDDDRGWLSPRGLMVIAVVCIVGLVAQSILNRFVMRLVTASMEDPRIRFAVTTVEAAWQALPFGTGLGSFVPLYAVYERTADIFTEFGNRAHNDLVEFALELGAVGVLAMVLAVVWLSQRIWFLWRRADADSDTLLLQRACAIAAVLVVLHSVVDYPLRTTAMAVVFAFCLGVLTLPVQSEGSRGSERRHIESRASERRHGERRRRRPAPEPRHEIPEHGHEIPELAPRKTPLPQSEWMSEVEWPDAWKKDD